MSRRPSTTSKSEDRYNELVKRAKNDPEVHKQLVQIMEEDDYLANAFTKHLQRRFGDKFDKLSSDKKVELVKQSIMLKRIPTNKKGGKTATATRTSRKSKNATRKSRKSKKTAMKNRKSRKSNKSRKK